VSFPAGKRADAQFKGFTIQTDQSPRGGGEGSAPEPFDLFLASIATCAGVVRAAELCAVKNHILEPPAFEIRAGLKAGSRPPLLNRFRVRRLPSSEAMMAGWLEVLIVVVVWCGLQAFVLPRLGVPT